ncbi:MAG: phosphatase PAP2 family protein [Spirochaetia bacterium]|jgi:membrane-associated phospholipid phosphatase|nr:phosphatase PAP2 family protein [Spirochaetia bacterium]
MHRYILILASLISISIFCTEKISAESIAYNKKKAPVVYEIDMLRETVLFTAGAAMLGTNLFVKEFFPAETASEYGYENFDKNDINIFDRWAASPYSKTVSNISDFALGAVILSPLLLTLDESLSDTTVYLVMYGETMLLSHSFKELVKSTFPRFRPYNYSSGAADVPESSSESMQSFFSGHTSSAFSAAAFLSTVYSNTHPEGAGKYLVSIASYSSAAAVGVLRIAAGQHFPSDVVAGAAWGTFIGIFIPKIHEVKNGKADNADFLFYPSGPGSINFKLRF